MPCARPSMRSDICAHQPVARRGEAAGERAVIIGLLALPGDFLAVHVAEHHRHLLAFERFVIVLRLIHPKADALVLNRLAGPINRAVGEKNGRRVRLRLAGADSTDTTTYPAPWRVPARCAAREKGSRDSAPASWRRIRSSSVVKSGSARGGCRVLSRCQTEISAPLTGSPELASRTKPSMLPPRVRVISARSLTQTSVMETMLSLSPKSLIVAGGDEVIARLQVSPARPRRKSSP